MEMREISGIYETRVCCDTGWEVKLKLEREICEI
jgi:hypothetical protein